MSAPKGSTKCSFSVDVGRRWKSEGETKEATDWFNIEVWGKLDEYIRNIRAKADWFSPRVACKKTLITGQGNAVLHKGRCNQIQMLDRKPKVAEEEA